MIQLDARWPEHVEGTPGGVPERVVGQQVGFDDEPVERTRQRPAPGPAEQVLAGLGRLVKEFHHRGH